MLLAVCELLGKTPGVRVERTPEPEPGDAILLLVVYDTDYKAPVQEACCPVCCSAEPTPEGHQHPAPEPWSPPKLWELILAIQTTSDGSFATDDLGEIRPIDDPDLSWAVGVAAAGN